MKKYLKLYKEFLLKLSSANLDGNGYVVCVDFYINVTGTVGSNVVYDGTSLICIDESKINVLSSKDAAKIIALCGGLKCLYGNFPSSQYVNFNKAIKIDSTIIKYYRARTVSKLKLKDYEGSLTDYSKIIELDNKNIDAYMKRADVNYYLKNNAIY